MVIFLRIGLWQLVVLRGSKSHPKSKILVVLPSSCLIAILVSTILGTILSFFYLWEYQRMEIRYTRFLKPIVSTETIGIRGEEHRMELSLKAEEYSPEEDAKNEERLYVGIGMIAGEVVLGSMGNIDRRDFTCIGDNVNITARLCSTAKQSEILIPPKPIH